MNEQTKLVETVKNYFPKLNVENINKAYIFGKKHTELKLEHLGIHFFHTHLRLLIYLLK